jgi:hypothetical protein
MDGKIHAAVFASIAAGLAKKSDCRSAIVVVSAAEQLLSSEIIPIPKYISELRRSCQESLPNKALLGAFQ